MRPPFANPRTSPLIWQILTAAWDAFLDNYEKKQRPTIGPLRPNVITAARNFLRCGDLAAGSLRFHCPGCSGGPVSDDANDSCERTLHSTSLPCAREGVG